MRTLILASLPAICGTLAAEVRGPLDFGKTKDGGKVEKYILKNVAGMSVHLITRGATITEIHVPDRNGAFSNVVLGFDDVAGYESDANQYFGCTTGRVANRIAKGKFTINGKEVQLAVNNGPNHLHGGVKRSLDKVIWQAKVVEPDAVEFSYVSPDGEEGYPGKLSIKVRFALSAANALHIDYHATTDRATPVNLTNHSYFNLAGAGNASVLDHLLTVHAEEYTPADETLIPTGKIAAVAGTPLDFTKPTRIGARIDALIKTPFQGYDHNFVLEGGMKKAATLTEPTSGRELTLTTDQPGIQIYSGNFLKGQKGAGGKTFAHRSAICLETQKHPNAVNTPGFPSVILEPGEEYRHRAIFEFTVRK